MINSLWNTKVIMVPTSFQKKILFSMGRLSLLRPLISYEGESAKKIVKAFHEAVDEYLSDCEERGKEPDRPFKGTFNVRVGEELHRKLVIAATKKKLSLNNYVKRLLEESA